MSKRIVFTEDADADVVASYRWYERQEPGLGEEFLRCIEACLASIQRHPKMYPVAFDEFRRALIRRFPYEIFYEVRGEELVVYTVFHCSQDPDKWRSRLRGEG